MQSDSTATFAAKVPNKDFKFKYVPEDAFTRIVNQVQRSRKKVQEEKEWLKHLEEKEKVECNTQMELQEAILHTSRLSQHQQMIGPSSPPEPQQTHPNYQYQKHEGESFSEDNEEICPENNFSLQTIPEEQLSDCECLLAKEPSDSKLSYESGSSDKQTDGNTNLLPAPKFKPKESVHVRRIKHFRKNINASLESICDLLNNIPEPDGIEDLRRREQRAAEFLSWICRNYHYKLQRQICDIRKQMKGSCTGARNTFYLALCQKLVAAHQTTSQALQAYVNHLPSSVGTGVPNKLRELLKFLIQLCQLNVKLGIIDSDVTNLSEDVIEKLSKYLLLKLKLKKQYDIETGDTHTSESQTTIHKKVKKESHKIDLSMYEPRQKVGKLKGRCWKKSSAILAKAKFGSPPKPQKPQQAKPCQSKSNLSEQGTSADSKDEEWENQETLFPYYEEPKRNIRNDVAEKFDDAEHVEENLIETLIDFTKTIMSQMKEGSKMLEHKPSAREAFPIASAALESKRTDSSSKLLKRKTLKIDLASLNHIEGIMQQLEEIIPKQTQAVPEQSEPNQLPNRYSAKQGRRSKRPSKHSKESQGQSKKDSKNVKLICLEYNSSEEHNVNKYSENNPSTGQSTTNHVLHLDVKRKQRSVLTSPSREPKCSAQDITNNKQNSHCGDNVLLTNETATPEMPSNWEPNTQGKVYEWRDGMFISVEHQNEFKRHATFPEVAKPGSDIENKHPTTPVSDSQHKNITESPVIYIEHLTKSEKQDHNKTLDKIGNDFDANKEAVPLPVQLTISSADELSALNYHKRFHNYTSTKCMYREPKKPWIMMTRLANHLIHDILNDVVVNEIGIDNITKSLIELEFK